MDEAACRAWIAARDVPRGTLEAIDTFAALLRDESERQNLIARPTFEQIWCRHILDSAQLLTHAPGGSWVDVGTGAGFPGLIIAIMSDRSVTLIEPRARRANFLNRMLDELQLRDRVTVQASEARAFTPARPYAVLSARAVAALPDLLKAASNLADQNTVWLLPKGRSAAEELEAARASWQGEFELRPSITDPQASIIVARHVRPRNRR